MSHETTEMNYLLKQQEKIRSMQSAMVAPVVVATLNVAYEDANTGQLTEVEFMLSQTDPELKALLNDLGARMSANVILKTLKAK